MWNRIVPLGELVVYVDTDSCKSIAKGGIKPKTGTALGGWEDEGQLVEFVSTGLKSYGTRDSEGKESVKIKGVSLKRAHSKLINFDVLKDMLMDEKSVLVPQLSFDYKIGKGISTREYLKLVKFDSSILKGDYDSDLFQVFPFGYDRTEIEK
jgi:hypothetical protein